MIQRPSTGPIVAALPGFTSTRFRGVNTTSTAHATPTTTRARGEPMPGMVVAAVRATQAPSAVTGTNTTSSRKALLRRWRGPANAETASATSAGANTPSCATNQLES